MIRVLGVLTLVLVCLPIAEAADGGNKLINGTFDVDVYPWVPLLDTIVEWNAMDADGNPASGSGMVTNSTSYQSTRGARQCSDVLEEDMEYFVRAMVNNPSGQTGLGWADIRLDFYPEPNCGGSPVGFGTSSAVYSTSPDQWLESWVTLRAPAGTQSAVVDLSVSKNTVTGTLTISFDNVKLFATEVIEDDFESGGLSGWPVVYP